MAIQGLTPSIRRSLNDKMYEKRKVAALEVEKLVRSYLEDSNVKEIEETVTTLGDEFTLAQNPNSRKGGLIGLAACAIALGNQKVSPYLENLMKPVLVCSRDADSRIRYFACESLYNIVKVSRTDSLKFFNELFDVLSKLSADQDVNVRNGSDLLDRLLMDIVSEKPVFDVPTFVMLLRERLYTKNHYTRRFLVNWLNCVMAIPEIDILAFLPEFLEALFLILGDPNSEIRRMCQATLGDILNRIGGNSATVDFSNMMNIVILHCQNPDPLIKETALAWMHKFIVLGGDTILPLSAGIVTSLLPTLAYGDNGRCKPETAKVIREKAEEANSSLMQLITIDRGKGDQSESERLSLPLSEILDVFSDFLSYDSTLTKCAVLRWITHLLVQIPHSVFQYIDRIFNNVINMICDQADDVVLLTLSCVAEIALSPAGTPMNSTGTSSKPNFSVTSSDDTSQSFNVYFSKFIKEMLLLFRNNNQLLEVRSSFIIRQICILLNPMNVFHAIGTSINDEDEFRTDPHFCAHAVQRLNGILMTSPEMTNLRSNLKNNTSQENCDFFCCLYKSWCHSPIASVTLCLLTQNYKHCCMLLKKLSDFDLTVDVLAELDKLVCLLESPIFSYLRLQLLESPHRKYLVKTMYSLLMLLPQSKSFATLNKRLNSLPNLPLPSNECDKNEFVDGDHLKDVNFDQLFEHFVAIQEKHRAFRQGRRYQV